MRRVGQPEGTCSEKEGKGIGWGKWKMFSANSLSSIGSRYFLVGIDWNRSLSYWYQKKDPGFSEKVKVFKTNADLKPMWTLFLGTHSNVAILVCLSLWFRLKYLNNYYMDCLEFLSHIHDPQRMNPNGGDTAFSHCQLVKYCPFVTPLCVIFFVLFLTCRLVW